MPFSSLRKTSIKKMFQGFDARTGGLLAFVQPLLTEITRYHMGRKKEHAPTFDRLYQHYMRSFISYAPIAVAFLDTDMRFQATSQPWGKWFRSFLESLPQKNPSKLYGVSLKNLEASCPKAILTSVKKTLSGQPYKSEGLKLNFSKGPRWVRFESFPIFSQQHVIQGCIIFCEDITHQKRLKENQKRLREINGMLQNFSIIFSHDFIQPLRQISNYMQILSDTLEKEGVLSAPTHDLLKAMDGAIHQSRELCEAVVFYCKQGRFTANPEIVNLKDIIQVLKERCFSHTHTEFKNQLPDTLFLYMNRACVFQLFQNLFTNAVIHGKSHSSKITLSGQPLSEQTYQFTLHNNGGYTKRLGEQHVFDPFTSSARKGAGLGLMICKKIVNAYGGEISFHSSPRQGTRVIFTLPLYYEDVALGGKETASAQ